MVRLFLGMVAGNVVGGVMFKLARVIGQTFGKGVEEWVAEPSLFLVPSVIGVVAAWVWKPLELRVGATALHSLSCTALGLAGAWLFFGEGAICLLMVAPLLYLEVFAGATLGRIWFRRKKDTLNLCLLPVVMFAVVAEPLIHAPHEGVVIDEIRIAAPPARVWPHVLAFSEIPAAPDYWLFRLGLPYPTATTNGGNFVGADRACEFSGGAVFRERVAEIEPLRLLTFEIVESPPHPELIGHLDAKRGQFELRDNGDGTTTLVGRTWYRLHVRPAWYFDWWTHDIFRAVHLRVMDNVKRLAETGA